MIPKSPFGNGAGYPASAPATPRIGHLLGQDAFLRELSFERKRTERSGAPFLLMLVRGDGPGGQLERDQLTAIGHALLAANRATDITGWYQAPHTLGTIFTSLGNGDRAASRATLEAKVAQVLAGSVGPSQMGQIRVSFHFFPEDRAGGPPETELDGKLYPDLMPQEASRVALWKRSVDILGSLGALILFSPLWLLIAALIKATSRGPVLYKQKRLGRFAKEFTCLKFRSMCVDNDEEIHKRYVQGLILEGRQSGKTRRRVGAIYKLTADPRVTRVGRFLRKSSLDELPQFLNVLRGDMSLVGPRPPIPYEFACYAPWHKRRLLEVTPGITGLWQVTGRSRTTFDDMVRLDLNYTRRQSLWLDLRILLKTPLAVLGKGGAY